MFERLTGVIGDTLTVNPAEITPATTLTELEVDSLALVELALQIEDVFGVHLDDEEMQRLNSVGDILSLIEQRSVARR